jgi:hypothetical protein
MAVEGKLTRQPVTTVTPALRLQMYGRASFDLLRHRVLAAA